MPGGGVTGGKQPDEMTLLELVAEILLRGFATGVGSLLTFVWLRSTEIALDLRVGLVVFSLILVIVFGVGWVRCLRELWRRF